MIYDTQYINTSQYNKQGYGYDRGVVEGNGGYIVYIVEAFHRLKFDDDPMMMP